jgi:putative nucleotidyltransferase with HDIG domain
MREKYVLLGINLAHLLIYSFILRFAMFRSIRLKLSGFIFVLLGLTTFAFSLATLKVMNQIVCNEIIKRAETLSKSTAAAAAYSLISSDSLGMDHIVFEGKNSNSDIEYMAIVDEKMKIIAHSDIRKRGEVLKDDEGRLIKKNEDGTIVKQIPFSSNRIFEIYAPILFKDRLIGAVYVGVNQSVLLKAQQTTRRQIFWLFVITFLLAMIGVFVLSVFITRPIKELASGVDELKQGKRARPLRIYSTDELGRLTESFNRMSQTITEQQGELRRYTQELEEAYVSIVRVLAVAIDARDPYTLGHSSRVASYSLRIGEEIGLKKEELEELEVASLFHDVGKLKTPDSILMKKQPLDPWEIKAIKHHPEDGAEMLGKVKSLQKYVLPVRHHHEHYDGRGYPDGLKGDRIPLHSAIIAIADTFDAMTSTRPYRRAMSKAEALLELKKGARKQFHPDLVEAFLRVMEQRGDRWLQPVELYLAKVI